jgi:hypothetical protein
LIGLPPNFADVTGQGPDVVTIFRHLLTLVSGEVRAMVHASTPSRAARTAFEIRYRDADHHALCMGAARLLEFAHHQARLAQASKLPPADPRSSSRPPCPHPSGYSFEPIANVDRVSARGTR